MTDKIELTPEEREQKSKEFMEAVHKTMEQIQEQRNEIIIAFLAKYNCQPDECEQVFVNDGVNKKWFIQKREVVNG